MQHTWPGGVAGHHATRQRSSSLGLRAAHTTSSVNFFAILPNRSIRFSVFGVDIMSYPSTYVGGHRRKTHQLSLVEFR